MNKQVKQNISGKAIIIGFLLVFTFPSLTYAAWWKPSTWFKKSIVSPASVQVGTTTAPMKPVVVTPTHLLKTEALPVVAKKVQSKASIRPPQIDGIVETIPVASVTPPPKKTYTLPSGAVVDERGNILNQEEFAEIQAAKAEEEAVQQVQTTQAQQQQLIVPKTVTVEPQQQSQPQLPLPSASQVAGIMLLCDLAKENMQVSQSCSDGTLWNGYNTNIGFRTGIDAMVQALRTSNQQILVAKQQQQKNCDVILQSEQNLLRGMKPSARLLAEKEACGTATTADETNYQLQQLKDSTDSNTTAIQQRQLQNTSTYIQPSPSSQTKCTTEPWWDAGILRYATKCTPASY